MWQTQMLRLNHFSIKLSKYFLLLPGSHRVKISADGYYDLKSKLLVSKTKYQRHVLTLTKLPGKIELNIEPVDEVDVSIDGNKYGSTNKFILKVPAGKELLNFQQKRYLPKTIDVDVYGMVGHSFFLNWNRQANINIDSSPENAQIMINDNAVNRNTFSFEIMQGAKRLG